MPSHYTNEKNYSDSQSGTQDERNGIEKDVSYGESNISVLNIQLGTTGGGQNLELLKL